MGGFAEVDADEVTVLVNKAELGSSIDAAAAEAAFQKASTVVVAWKANLLRRKNSRRSNS